MPKFISVIVPIHNEEKSLKELFSKIFLVLEKTNNEYEIVAIDDGSSDNSLKILKDIAAANKKLRIICFRGNFGQTAAISAGVKLSRGNILIPIDADLENDPEDIPKLIEKLEEGYDVVSGWRKNRWEHEFLGRKLPSIIANWLISRITKVKLHDYGCTLKAYRREVVEDISLYGEMHRFIPVYTVLRGAKSTEIEVSYRPRKYGHSHYNMRRIFKVPLDLITITFLSKYFTRPIHFFGKIGMYVLAIGIISGLYAIYLRIAESVSFIATPLTLLAIISFMFGCQFVLMGLLGEVVVRTYFESQQKQTFLIKEKINFE